MFQYQKYKSLFLVLTILLLAVYFSGLYTDVTRDAGKYATIAKEIYQNGNYINLTVHGEAYDQKPPLLFWLGAAGFHTGTISNFWFKLPVLLLVFLGFYWAYQLGRSLYNKRVGYLTALFLAFSFIYTFYSSDIHTDTPLQAFITLALWQFSEFIKTRREKNWLLAFTATGLAMLCKGPIGAAIPAFAVVGHLLIKKEFKFLSNFRWYAGTVLAFLITIPALAGLMNQFGWEGIRFFFWENNVGRITGSYIKAVNDPFFYVHNLLYLFLPWSLLFFIASFLEFKYLVKNRFKSNEYFTLTGIWIFFIILNTASSQLPNYVFSIVPLIAVLTAKWTDKALDNQNLFRIFQITQDIVVILLWLLIFSITFYLFPAPGVIYWIIAGAGAGITLYSLYFRDDPAARIFIPSIAAFLCFALLINIHVMPYALSFQAPPKAARHYTENAGQDDRLYNYLYDQYELFFYSDPEAIQISKKDDPSKYTRKGSWIFTDQEGYEKLRILEAGPDSIIEYSHVYLNRPVKFLNPKTREESIKTMYLLIY